MKLLNLLLAGGLLAGTGTLSAAEAGDNIMFRAVPAPPAVPAMPTMVWGPGTFASPGMVMGRLFPPTLIMRQQEQLGLSDQQKEAIKAEMRTFQSDVVDVQWELQSSQEALDALLNADAIDASAAAAAIDRVLQAENALKKQHLLMLVRIRNVLEPGQVEILEKSMSDPAAGAWTVPLPPLPPG